MTPDVYYTTILALGISGTVIMTAACLWIQSRRSRESDAHVFQVARLESKIRTLEMRSENYETKLEEAEKALNENLKELQRTRYLNGNLLDTQLTLWKASFAERVEPYVNLEGGIKALFDRLTVDDFADLKSILASAGERAVRTVAACEKILRDAGKLQTLPKDRVGQALERCVAQLVSENKDKPVH